MIQTGIQRPQTSTVIRRCRTWLVVGLRASTWRWQFLQ